jgi:hypothetical protein
MLASAGTATALLAGCITIGDAESTTEDETRRFDADTVDELAIDNVAGPITVAPADGTELVVELERTGTDHELDATTVADSLEDGRLALETTHEDGPLGFLGPNPATVAFSVQCPDGVAVDRVETNSGDLSVRDVAGPVAMSTTNGEIDARGVGAVGDVTTTNGEIAVDVAAIEDDAVIESTNGVIEAALHTELDASVTAETTNGSVTADDALGLTASEDGVSGTLGDGTHDLTIDATNGDVTLTALSE